MKMQSVTCSQPESSANFRGYDQSSLATQYNGGIHSTSMPGRFKLWHYVVTWPSDQIRSVLSDPTWSR